jgi:hypothetical protein
MAEKIQRIPSGLLSALSIVGSGQNARLLLDEVRTVVDSEKYYFANQWENIGDIQNVQNIGDGILHTVPQGQYWLVGGASFSVTLAAGDGVGAFVGWRPGPGGSTIVGEAYNQPTGTSAAAYSLRVAMKSLPVLLSPGGVIRGQLTANLGAARSANLYAAIVRLTF